ncbi:SDR family oxidoreductase [Agrobacterium sp. a22-2]|uniref:SDR family oxidoreductase n=1 Tax=Agrobacterium sp. a22-2 TaxID=2283840 RepID=UPI0014484E0F|nr:SDR family oxidoreductase [Agrobacterium sp. a22-2]NKN36277.1 SDR family oxidoreductase [Agrobacterium sp. a22-2]
MKILILGGTGFIGTVVLQRLLADGHRVTGLGRDIRRAHSRYPQADWIAADLATLQEPDAWRPLLADQDAIVNCAGALQDGLSDDLVATQQNAMLTLYRAAQDEKIRHIVQISARVDGAGADLPFLATKRIADAALATSGLPHTILRPALVVGRNAFGGTALLRALAAFPFVLPLIHPGSPLETVDVDDVAKAVSAALEGSLGTKADLDLAATGALSLKDALALHRAWLGLDPAGTVELPPVLARPVTALADLAGHLGWRSPLRSTAMAIMAEGVIHGPTAAPAPLPLKTLAETLASHPAGVQDLWFARLYLLKAPVILTLSLFWLLSGLVPLLDTARAAAHFAPLMAPAAALAVLLLTCLIDVGLGLAILVRPWARYAMIGMLTVTVGYLGSATLVEPALWTDPLGPLVKVPPSILLTLVSLAILEER